MLHKGHDEFENTVAAWLLENDWILPPAPTYHSYMPKDIQDILKSRFDETSLYVRTRADRLAIHRTKPVTMEWEVKTIPNYRNFACEALPLAHHIQKADLGVVCVYAAIHVAANRQYGFLVNESMPMVSKVFLPTRWTAESATESRTMFSRFWPHAQYINQDCGGSGDPFVVINESDVAGLPHWKEVFQNISEISP